MADRERKVQPERVAQPIIKPGEKIPSREKAPVKTPQREKVPTPA